MTVKEEELVFEQTGFLIPTWEIKHKDKTIALVVQRIIKQPTYAVLMIQDGEELEETCFEERDEIVDFLLKELN